MKVNITEILEGLKINYKKKYPPHLSSKNNIAIYVQQKLIQDNFEWLKTVVSNNVLVGAGKIKPKGCKSVYDIIFKYDPFSKERKEKIFVKNSNIRFGNVPHLYNDHSLCLYYPKDLPIHLDFNFVDTIPWISKWLITYELWLKYGVWLDKEVKH